MLEHIDYEITKGCNLHCVHCSAEAGKGSPPNLGLIKKVLSEARVLGLKRVGITGGEPFLFREELSDLIDFSFDELGCLVHIHTNGQLVEQNIGLINEGAEKIEDITLTLLGYKGVHDLNSGFRGAYERVKSAAQQLSDCPIQLSVFLIPFSNNYHELPEAARDFYGVGVRRFRIMRLSPGGRARKNYEKLRLNDEQREEFISGLELLEEELEIGFEAGFCTRLLYPKLEALRHHDLCMSGVNRLHINADGYVFPCTASSGFIEMNVGNIHEKDLKEVWESERLERFRKLHTNGCKVQGHYRGGEVIEE